jgi:protease-4
LFCHAGCHHKPLRVQATGTARVTTEMPPVSNAAPLQPWAVPSCGCGPDQIAIVDVDGVLLNMDMVGLGSMGENPVSLFRERLDRVAANPCTRGLIVRINSPGGGVTACDIMWHDLQSFKARTHLPVVAVLMDVGAGGSYYLATAADQIVAHPTSVVGGIGVILNLYNLSDAMAQFNVVATPIRSGENIDLGSNAKPMSEEQMAILTSMANEFHNRFKQIVLQTRPQVDPDLATTFDGRIFTAQQAQQLALIDGIGYMDTAIGMVREVACAPSAQVVLYHRCNDPARTPYAITPNVPAQGNMFPVSLPGYDRSKLPTFLYLWQADPTIKKWGGH